MKAPLGWKIVWMIFLLTLVIWLATVDSYRFIIKEPFLFLSKAAVLVGTVGMCCTFVFSTRLPIFEAMFSGLDKVYHAHRLIAIWSFSLICLHPLFQFLRFFPNWKKGLGLFTLKKIAPIELGFLALILFTVLILLTLWIKIPYHIWKKTHDFFIFVLILTFFHSFYINKHINDSLLLSIWIYGFMFIAGVSYIYIKFLYRYIGPKYHYSIEEIEKRGKVWNIYLKSLSEKSLNYKPAQFVYLSFDNRILGTEAHPYSLSSTPDQPLLRISIKNLGDYTSRLDHLKRGDTTQIWGPYGRFYEKYLCENKNSVMIAGGIGITPFLSMLRYEATHPSQRITYLFYCVKNPKRAYFHDELLTYVKRNPSIVYIPWYSDSADLMNVDDLRKEIGHELAGKLYFLCGPLDMMELFIHQLGKKGVKNRNIIFEDFNLLD